MMNNCDHMNENDEILSIGELTTRIRSGDESLKRIIWFLPNTSNDTTTTTTTTHHRDDELESLWTAIRDHSDKCEKVTSVRLPFALQQSLYQIIVHPSLLHPAIATTGGGTTSNLVLFLRHINSFPNLEEIALLGRSGGDGGGELSSSSSSSSSSVPQTIVLNESMFAVLSSICLRRMKRLYLDLDLRLENLIDYGHVCRFLKRASLLQDLRLSSIIAPCSNPLFQDFSFLVTTLLHLPKLEHLTLRFATVTIESRIKLFAMRTLAHSTTLRTLKLVNFSLTNDHIAIFCDALNTPSTVLNPPNDDDNNNNQSAKSRLEAICLEESLPKITVTGCLHLWKLLQTNFTLTDIHVQWCQDEEDSSHDSVQLFCHLLQAEIQTLCKLNQAGRGKIYNGNGSDHQDHGRHETASSSSSTTTTTRRDDWIELLVVASENIGASYLLLQKNPGLYFCANRHPKQTNVASVVNNGDESNKDDRKLPAKRQRLDCA